MVIECLYLNSFKKKKQGMNDELNKYFYEKGMDDELKKYFYEKGFWKGFFTGIAISVFMIPIFIKLK
jgi:hypothetical protein